MMFTNYEMKNAPKQISGEHVTLIFSGIKPGDLNKGYVPFYHFRIIGENGTEVGHINFRVGETDHVLYCAGHIGYEIKEPFRGRSYSFYACKTIASFVRSIYEHVLITSNPENTASIKIIEKLGCEFIDQVKIAECQEAYKKGERIKNRYRWYP